LYSKLQGASAINGDSHHHEEDEGARKKKRVAVIANDMVLQHFMESLIEMMNENKIDL
jgi:hypothetical protein